MNGILLKIISVLLSIVGLISGTIFSAEKGENAQIEAAKKSSYETAYQIEAEGITLLKNKNNTLPVKDKNVNVFGVISAVPYFSGGGMGGTSPALACDLFQGLETAGVNYNSELFNLYYNYAYNDKISNEDYVRKEPTIGEKSFPYLSSGISNVIGMNRSELEAEQIPESIINNAKDFSDTAIYTIGAVGGTGNDLSPEDLQLTDSQRGILDMLNENFNHIIIIVNSSNSFELGFVNEYSHIDSVLWTGIWGAVGGKAVGDVIYGSVNPSGRLSDTLVYDNTSAPAVENYGEYDYENAFARSFINYEEGIYVGYRYYETFLNEQEYNETVLYPFGYGLSYTTFEKDVVSSSIDDNKVSISVKVKNSGNLPGKDVVELYYAAPYTGTLEKSSKNLSAYSKTKELLPGESQTLVLTYDFADMAQYSSERESYVLEKGEYNIYVSNSAHSSFDTLTYNLENEKLIKADKATGTEYSNLFSQADGNLTYLSRSDPQATYPTSQDNDYTMPKWIKKYILSETITKVTDCDEPKTEVENGIMLSDLSGLSYQDELWEKYLDQFSVEDMSYFVTHCMTGTKALPQYGIPKVSMADGPSGVGTFFSSFTSIVYPCEVVIASTFNDELVEQMGENMGTEAKLYDITVIWGPGLNIHRTAFGGRNFEYYSEDPLLSGKCAAAYVRGCQSVGTLCTLKHFALNDQEIYRCKNGLYIWSSEQALREIYFKPFEIAVEEGNAHAIMSSFIRVGAEWCGHSDALLNGLLREEWGFKGFVITDNLMTEMPRYTDASTAIRAGNDLMIEALIPDVSQADIMLAVKCDRAGTITALRNACHNLCYAYANSSAVS